MKFPVGMKVNALTLIQRETGNLKGLFRCDCGTEKWIKIAHVGNGVTRSCGCAKRVNHIHAGQVFGRLSVVRELEPAAKKRWAECRCECGNVKRIEIANLFNGQTRSCGCLVKEQVRALSLKHGEEGTRLYRVWSGMKARCEIPSGDSYRRYGGRGISVCPEWSASYIKFRNWAMDAGYQDELQIDRIDNDGNYDPSNCRFVSPRKNANNRGNHVWLDAFGERKTMSDWARDSRCAVSYATLKTRIKRGFAAEVAIARPSTR